MRATLVLLVLASLLGGCTTGIVGEAPVAPTAPGFPQAVAYGASSALPAKLATPVVHPLAALAVEPSIGITKDGAIFVIAQEDVMRSKDNGSTWQRVQSLAVARGEDTGRGNVPFTFDPWLAVDPVTDRVYVDHLSLACTTAAWSDDRGDTWTPLDAVACGVPVTDFQKTAAGVPGPVANPLAGKAYPSVTYICYNKAAQAFVVGGGRYGTSCATSYDGGATYQNEQALSQAVDGPKGPILPGCYGGAWGPIVGPDGTVVVRAQPDCMFRSKDSGASWEAIGKGPPFGGTQFAFDRAGTLYALSFPDRALQMARSADGGVTWSAPWNVTPPHVESMAFPAIVAGDKGRVSVAFLGNDTYYNDTEKAPETTRWDAYMLAIEDADTAPRIVSYRATPQNSPMHVGCISRLAPCPFMGDFVTMAAAPDGTPYVVFPDTCNSGCEGNPTATAKDAKVVLASVVGLPGWSLRAAS